MDINRGSRRARHVAAALRSNDEQRSDNGNGDGNEAPPPRSQHQRHQQRLTPTNNSTAHRTPEQELSGGTSNNLGGRVPPMNPFRLHRALPHTRLSMPEISDESDSEPDTSALGMARERLRAREAIVQQAGLLPRFELTAETAAAPTRLGPHDTSMEDEDDDEDEEDLETVDDDDDEDHEGEQEAEEATPLIDPATMGLKEISNLGRFTVSSHKQGNGVEELRSDDLNLYWQSDGPQPHNLTIYFVKRVEIRDLRFYVNYADDESYTPTKIIFRSGTSENSLIEFAQMTLDQPLGWQQVNITGAGGGPDGNTLVSYVLQMQILENHQNGKDTHLRGIKIYAFDADSAQGPGRENNPVDDMVEFIDGSAATRAGLGDEKERLSGLARRLAETTMDSGDAGFSIPDFMRDPEIR